MCYARIMKTIAQRELRNQSGEILRQTESGEQFTITVEGRPVALLVPLHKRQWVKRAEYLRAIRSAPADPTFREDVRELGGTLEDLDGLWAR